MSESVVSALASLDPRSRRAPAWAEAGRTWSVDDLLRAADAAADAFRRATARPGALWAVHGESGAAALAGSLGARLAGAVPALEGSGASVPRVAGRLRLDASLAAIAAEPVGEGLALPRGTAWIRTTGGTTGDPRLVAFTESQALAGVRASIALLGLRAGDVVATTVPPWTAFGWNSGALVPLLSGAFVRSVPPVSPRGLVEPGARTAWIVTTGPVVRALARLRVRSDGGGAPLRVLVAGGPYPEDDARALLPLGVAVIDRYGASEVGPIAQAREALGRLVPAPGLSVAAAGDPPTVEVRGASVGIGYVGGRSFDGTFRTPDVASFEPDGSFRLVRRADRAIKRMGRVVDLAHVEREVARAPGVALARVVVEPGGLDVAVVAQAVPRGGAALDARAVLSWLGERLDPWERPVRVDVVPPPPAGAESKWAGAPEGARA